ncbi:MAG: hypothetical protein IPG53_17150 [Ignavibacteriales bacterium]|nr:hypothetical protein [Ignavibacteriales bacterium]
MADALYTGGADKDVCEIGVDAIPEKSFKDPKDYELLIAAGKIYYAVPDGTNALKFYKSALDKKTTCLQRMLVMDRFTDLSNSLVLLKLNFRML